MFPKKVTAPLLDKKSPPPFCENRRLISAFTTAHHLSLFWVRSIQPTPPSYFLKIYFNIILPFSPSSSKWSRSGHRHNHYHHHHRYHQLAIMQLGHPLTHSFLTHPEVSLIVSPGFIYLLVYSSFIILSNLLQGVLFTGHKKFVLYSCILSKTAVTFCSFAISVIVLICPAASCYFTYTFHLCCCYSSCISCIKGPVFKTV